MTSLPDIFGVWAMAPARVKALMASLDNAQPLALARGGRAYNVDADGVATISIHGPSFKGGAAWGYADPSVIRGVVMDAASDNAVRGIMLHVDSPGGGVAGTDDLAQAVAFAAGQKPVHAYVEDLAASAAYWVASQADRITANRAAEIGSIGVFAVVEDWSAYYENAGVKVHVISTGDHKGAFVEGAPVEEHHLADVRDSVLAYHQMFTAAVKKGRGARLPKLADVADGRTWIASDAQMLGLVDAVGSLDKARRDLATIAKRSVRAKAAAHRLRFG